MNQPRARSAAEAPFSAPAGLGVARRVVATAIDLPTAERAIRRLEDGGIAEHRVVVTARGLHRASRLPAARSAPQVLFPTGLLGALVGVLVGWLSVASGLVTSDAGAAERTVSFAILGAVFGASLGLAGYGLTHGHESSTESDHFQADHFDVLVDADVVDCAVRVLHGGSISERVPPPRAYGDSPNASGEHA